MSMPWNHSEFIVHLKMIDYGLQLRYLGYKSHMLNLLPTIIITSHIFPPFLSAVFYLIPLHLSYP